MGFFESYTGGMRRLTVFLIFCLTLSGCDVIFGPPPTETPTPSYIDLPPSPTFDIQPPTNLPDGDVLIGMEGMNNATAAALSAETAYVPGMATADASRRPVLIMIPLPSNAQLNAELWLTGVTAPAVILVGSTFEDWGGFPAQLRDGGYAVVTVEGGLEGDYQANLQAVFNAVAVQPGLDPARMIIVGVQGGADAGFVACAYESRCLGAILISPQAASNMESAASNYNPRSILLAASQEESASLRAADRIRQLMTGPVILQPFEGAGSGIQILYNRPDMATLILEFLASLTR